MAQSVITTNLEDFEKKLLSIQIPNLLRLIEGIAKLVRTASLDKSLPDECILDLLRKETKITAELMRRGYLKKEEYQQFEAWRKGLGYKKRFY